MGRIFVNFWSTISLTNLFGNVKLHWLIALYCYDNRPGYFEPALDLDLIGILHGKILATPLDLPHDGGEVVDVIRGQSTSRGGC